jgi:hypothetical protein
VTRYRLRVFMSPNQQPIAVKTFTAMSLEAALHKAHTIAAYLRHRKKVSIYVMAWALDELRTDPIRWVTVATR